MSRPGQASNRNLTLTEELEKLEQSITLTLQEIDHNFSKAHRIVTTSILPLVEQYGEQSKSVWESSKFWKQFFEASANVSLSGYEEPAGEDEETTTAEETALEDTTSEYNAAPADTTVDEQSAYQEQHDDDHMMEDSQFVMDGEVSGSTPRPPASKLVKPQFADLGSPYEKLRREMKSGADAMQAGSFEDDDTMDIGGVSTTPQSNNNSLLDESLLQNPLSTARKDPLLHRVLNKNYRIQTTPLKSAPRGTSPSKGTSTKKEGDGTRRNLFNDSPMSSPEMEMPKLRSDLYTMSPVKSRKLLSGAREGPRTPGISVQTPGTARKTKDVFADTPVGADTDKGKGKATATAKRDPDEITWESDEDDTSHVFGGMSPPKTIQFAMPQSKLMQTPAREASKRIVDDILLTAGAAPDDDTGEYSPTMVKMNKDILDDSF